MISKHLLITATLTAATLAAAQSAIRWEPLCEPGVGGAMVSLAASPHTPRHLIVSGDMLGTAVSRDGGDSWQPSHGLPSYEMCAITFHSADPKTVWVGSCIGPFKSVDGGASWVAKRNGMPPPSGHNYSVIVEKILFDPANPRRLLAFCGSSRRWNEADTFGWIWESTDNGETWTHTGTIAHDGFSRDKKKGANIVFATYEPNSKSNLHLLADGAGWMTSTDNGKTWRKKSHAGINAPVEGITFHPANPAVIWAATGRTPGADGRHLPGGIFKSTDNGATFLPSDTGIEKVASDNPNLTSLFLAVAVSPAAPDLLFANDQAWNANVIYVSRDGGKSWHPSASRHGVGVGASAAARAAFQVETACFAGVSMKLVAHPTLPGHAYGFNTEFILRTTDAGKTWDDASSFRPDPAKPDHWRGRGWTGWCSMDVAFNPFRKDQSVLLAMDAARGWISDDSLNSWRYTMGQANPWIGGQSVAFSRDGHIYITTGQHDNNGIQHSADFGATWTTLSGPARGLPQAGWGTGNEYCGIYVHPHNGSRAWAVLNRKLIKTENAGATWTPVPGPDNASQIAHDPATPGRFYLKTDAGILVTDDGATFTNIGLPRVNPRSRINCDARGRLLVCQWRAPNAGLWRYTPATQEWQRLLDDPQAYECNADPSDPSRLLLTTSMDPFFDKAGGNGLWISHDDGASWSPANDNLPMLRANACAFNPFDPGQIIVGTYGMGFFKARWPKSHKPAPTRRYTHTAEDTEAASTDVNLLQNPRMTEGGAIPTAWHEHWGDATAARDTQTFHSAPASLRVTTAPGKSGQFFQRLTGLNGATVRVTGWLKTTGSANINIALQSFPDDWSRNEFHQLHFAQGTSDWTPFDKTITLPDWASSVNTLLLLEGHGTAWLDDIRLTRLQQETQKPAPRGTATPSATNPANGTAPVLNGAMTHGHQTVAQWHNAPRDTQTFHSAPASLRVDNTATAHQRLDNMAGQRLRISGWLKTAGNIKAQVALQSFSEGWKDNHWQQLVYAQDTTAWTHFEKEITLPPWTAWSELKLHAEGNGTAWLDDIQNTFAGMNDGQPTTAADEIRTSPPPPGKPSQPAWCIYDWRSAWADMHNGFLARTKQGNIDLIAYGDSITQGWGDRPDALLKSINPNLTAVNYGIGGDSTRQLLWRIGHGEVDGLAPKLILLAIGTNNLYGDPNGGTDEEIVQGILAVAKLLREKLPDTPVLLLSLLPRQNDYFCNRVNNINRRLAQAADNKTLLYHDRTALFLASPGTVKKDLYGDDQLHLADAGYDVWDADLKPLLEKLLK